jgi:hypothetical protein
MPRQRFCPANPASPACSTGNDPFPTMLEVLRIWRVEARRSQTGSDLATEFVGIEPAEAWHSCAAFFTP